MILITGGTGFIGQALIRQLVSLGKPVRILLRPSQKSPRLPLGIPVDATVCSLRDERGLRAAMKGVEVIYHLASSEQLGSRSDLAGVDVDGTRAICHAASQSAVGRLFYLSHLGADRASGYAVLQAKAIAEGFIRRGSPAYTIFRSGPVFGPNDHFTVPLARMLRRAPGFFPMPGEGDSLIQPLYVEDLVTCMTLALEDEGTSNQLYEVGGSEYFSFHQVMDMLQAVIGTRRRLVSLSPAYLRMLSLVVEQAAPRFPISIFWLDTLSADRTTSLNTLPRLFGLLPARFGQQLSYLKQPVSKKRKGQT